MKSREFSLRLLVATSACLLQGAPVAAQITVTTPPSYYVFEMHMHPYGQGPDSGKKQPTQNGRDIVELDPSGPTCSPGDFPAAFDALKPAPNVPGCAGSYYYDYEELLRLIDRNMHYPYVLTSNIRRSMAITPSAARPQGYSSTGQCLVNLTDSCELGFDTPTLLPTPDLRALDARESAIAPGLDPDAVHVSLNSYSACDATTASLDHVKRFARFFRWSGEQNTCCFSKELLGYADIDCGPDAPYPTPSARMQLLFAALRDWDPAGGGTVLSTHLPEGAGMDYFNFNTATGDCFADCAANPLDFCCAFKRVVEMACGTYRLTLHQTHGNIHLNSFDPANPTGGPLAFLSYFFRKFDSPTEGFFLMDLQYVHLGNFGGSPYNKATAEHKGKTPDAILRWLLDPVNSRHLTMGTHQGNLNDGFVPVLGSQFGAGYGGWTAYWDEVFRRMYEIGLNDPSVGPQSACAAIQNISHGNTERLLGIPPLPGYESPCSLTGPIIADVNPKIVDPEDPSPTNAREFTITGSNFAAAATVKIRGRFSIVTCAANVTSQSSITATLPALPVVTEDRYEVLVENPGPFVSAPFRSLLVARPPEITKLELDPGSSGIAGTPTTIIITGKHLHDGRQVTLLGGAGDIVLPVKDTQWPDPVNESTILVGIPTSVSSGTYGARVTNVTSFGLPDGRFDDSDPSDGTVTLTVEPNGPRVVDLFPKNGSSGAARNTTIQFHLRDGATPILPSFTYTVTGSTLGDITSTYAKTTFPAGASPEKDIYVALQPNGPALPPSEVVTLAVTACNTMSICAAGTFSFEALPALTSDTDQDLLPDEWEQGVGLRTGASIGNQGRNGRLGDPDGDGLTNAQEYAAGRNPLDYQAVLAAPGPDPANPTIARAYYHDGVLADDGVAETAGPLAGVLGAHAFGDAGFGGDAAGINAASNGRDEIAYVAGTTRFYGSAGQYFPNGYLEPQTRLPFFAFGGLKKDLQVSVSAADIDGDGVEELVAAAPTGTGNVMLRVLRYDGTPFSPLATITWPGGGSRVNIATGDLVLASGESATGRPFEEIVTGAASALSTVRGWQLVSSGPSAPRLERIAGFALNPFPGTPAAPSVAVGNTHNVISFTNDPRFDEVYVGKGAAPNTSPDLRSFHFFQGDGFQPLGQYNVGQFPQDTDDGYGVRPGLADVDADGFDELMVTPGPAPEVNKPTTRRSDVRVYNIDGVFPPDLPQLIGDFQGFYDPFSSRGCNLSAINLGAPDRTAMILKTDVRLLAAASFVRQSPDEEWVDLPKREEAAAALDAIRESLASDAPGTNADVAQALRAVKGIVDLGLDFGVTKDLVTSPIDAIIDIYENDLVPSPGVVAEVPVGTGPSDLVLSIAPPRSVYAVSGDPGNVDRVDLATLSAQRVFSGSVADDVIVTAEDVAVTPGGKFFVAAGKRYDIQFRFFQIDVNVGILEVYLASSDDPAASRFLASYECAIVAPERCRPGSVEEILVVPPGGTAPAGKVYISLLVRAPIPAGFAGAILAVDGIDDLASATVTSIETYVDGSRLHVGSYMALSPILGDARVFVATDAGIDAIDTLTDTVTPAVFPLPATGMALVRLATGQSVGYLADAAADTLTALDLETGSMPGALALSGAPARVALTADRGLLVATLGSSDEVAVVRRSDLTLLRRVPVGRAPFDVVLSPDGSEAIVSNSGGSTLSVVLLQGPVIAPVVLNVAAVIDQLPDPAFKGPAADRRAAFDGKIQAISGMVAVAESMPPGPGRDGLLGAAVNKLKNDVLAKADGSLGGKPSNDWIVDPDAQLLVNDLVEESITTIEGMTTPGADTTEGDVEPQQAEDLPLQTLP